MWSVESGRIPAQGRPLAASFCQATAGRPSDPQVLPSLRAETHIVPRPHAVILRRRSRRRIPTAPGGIYRSVRIRCPRAGGRDPSLTLRMTEQGPHPAAFRQGSLKGPPRQPAGASAEQALRPSVRTGTPPLSQGGSKGRKTPQSASPTAPLSQGSLTGRKGLKKAGNFRKKVLTRRFCCAILCFTCRTRGFFLRAFFRAESAPASTQGGNAHIS